MSFLSFSRFFLYFFIFYPICFISRFLWYTLYIRTVEIIKEDNLMKKSLFILCPLLLCLFFSFALAESPAADPPPALPVYDPDSPEGLAASAVLCEYPDAEIHLVLKEWDDGKAHFDVFFRTLTQFGSCRVDEKTLEVRKARLFDLAENTLFAHEVPETLTAQKGELTLVSLELEYDDGRLFYEGEVSQGLFRYEFEMTVTGKITDWERD